MEKRKVQQVGHCTLNVSLPKGWVKAVGLKRGDSLFITPERNGSLRLIPSTMAETMLGVTRECVINSDLCDEPGMLERIIIGNYILGRDVLKVSASDRIQSGHVEEIRNIVRRLIGLGIVEEAPSLITMQCSIDASKFQMETLMRQLSTIVSTMYEEAVRALTNFDSDLARDAIRREDEVNMMYWLITRLLLSAQMFRNVADKIGLKEPLQIPDNRMISKYLETIADCSENIAQRAVALQKYKAAIESNVLNRLSHLADLAHSIFQKAIDCVYGEDIVMANSLLEMRKVLDMEEEQLIRQLPDIPHLSAIVLCISRIAESGAGIAVIALDRALEKPNDLCLVPSG